MKLPSSGLEKPYGCLAVSLGFEGVAVLKPTSLFLTPSSFIWRGLNVISGTKFPLFDDTPNGKKC